MDIKGLSEPKTVPLKAIEYDMHGRTVHLIPCGSYLCADCKQTAKWNVIEYADDAGDEHLIPVMLAGMYLPCGDCKQPARWNVIENAEDAGDEGGASGWLWCGVCSVGG